MLLTECTANFPCYICDSTFLKQVLTSHNGWNLSDLLAVLESASVLLIGAAGSPAPIGTSSLISSTECSFSMSSGV